jgi:transposase
VFDKEVVLFEREIHKALKDHKGYRAVQAIDGVGKTMAPIFVAEIGDVSRFPSPDRLACWVGLTPRHDESDTKVYRYGITKQGSKLVRWAAIEAVARYHGGAPIKPSYSRIAARRGNKIARVAAARKLLTLVYYGLRDGEVRCLAKAG